MELIYSHCCGLDVHKKSITACVLIAEGKTRRRFQRRFGTNTIDIVELASWAQGFGVTHIAMESTGVYWKPIWNLLEGKFELLLVNAAHIKNVPGRKTDMKDCEWIAQLLQHGLLRGSFVPERRIRELRDLNRQRVALIGERNRVANRVQKVLEDANIKLASVASDALGLSGRNMLDALIAGEEDPERLAGLARGLLKRKIDALRLALDGKVNEHHRFCLKQLLAQYDFINRQILECDDEIARRSEFMKDAIAWLDSIPGVDAIAARALLAEIGPDMEQFPTAKHCASWAGLCPGNEESAGKRLNSRTRKGSPWLRRVLVQTAWAASHAKNTYLRSQFHRLAARRGKKRALVGVAHTILVIAWHLLKRRCTYQELGGDYFERVYRETIERSLVRRLQRMGHQVILVSQPAAAV
jgi:transposase